MFKQLKIATKTLSFMLSIDIFEITNRYLQEGYNIYNIYFTVKNWR